MLLNVTKRSTYKVELLQTLGCIGQIHDCVVCQVCAICQTQLSQPREGIDAPVLEADVRDGGTACKVDAFDSVGGMDRDMCHTPVSNVFAVAQSQSSKLRATHDCAWR
jgi:hypothetical protein